MNPEAVWGPNDASAGPEDYQQLADILRRLPSDVRRRIREPMEDLINPSGGIHFPRLWNRYSFLATEGLVPQRLLARLIIRQQNNYLRESRFNPDTREYRILLEQRPALLHLVFPNAVMPVPGQAGTGAQATQQAVDLPPQWRQGRGRTEPPAPPTQLPEPENDDDDLEQLFRDFDVFNASAQHFRPPTLDEQLDIMQRNARAGQEFMRLARQRRENQEYATRDRNIRNAGRRMAGGPGVVWDEDFADDDHPFLTEASTIRAALLDPNPRHWITAGPIMNYGPTMGWTPLELLKKVRDSNARYLLNQGRQIDFQSDEGQELKAYFTQLNRSIEQLEQDDTRIAGEVGRLIADVVQNQRRRGRSSSSGPRAPRNSAKKK